MRKSKEEERRRQGEVENALWSTSMQKVWQVMVILERFRCLKGRSGEIDSW